MKHESYLLRTDCLTEDIVRNVKNNIYDDLKKLKKMAFICVAAGFISTCIAYKNIDSYILTIGFLTLCVLLSSVFGRSAYVKSKELQQLKDENFDIYNGKIDKIEALNIPNKFAYFIPNDNNIALNYSGWYETVSNTIKQGDPAVLIIFNPQKRRKNQDYTHIDKIIGQ